MEPMVRDQNPGQTPVPSLCRQVVIFVCNVHVRIIALQGGVKDIKESWIQVDIRKSESETWRRRRKWSYPYRF
jgi:hypothetical protein